MRDKRTIPLDFFRGRQSLAPFASQVRCIIVMAGAAVLHSFAASADVQFLPINVTTFPEKKIELCVHTAQRAKDSNVLCPLSLFRKRGQKANLLDHDCRTGQLNAMHHSQNDDESWFKISSGTNFALSAVHDFVRIKCPSSTRSTMLHLLVCMTVKEEGKGGDERSRERVKSLYRRRRHRHCNSEK